MSYLGQTTFLWGLMDFPYCNEVVPKKSVCLRNPLKIHQDNWELPAQSDLKLSSCSRISNYHKTLPFISHEWSQEESAHLFSHFIQNSTIQSHVTCKLGQIDLGCISQKYHVDRRSHQRSLRSMILGNTAHNSVDILCSGFSWLPILRLELFSQW